MTHFYSQIININSVILELDKMPLTDLQRHDLAKLVDSMVHQTVMDTVLLHLSEEDKFVFVEKLKQQNAADEMMEFLKSKIDNIEEKIIEAFEQLKIELFEDIKEAQNLFEKY